LIFYENWLDLEIIHAIPVWAEGPSLTLYISAVSEDIRTIFSETIDRWVLSPTNLKQPTRGHISTSGFIANMLCRVDLAFRFWPMVASYCPVCVP